MSSESPQNQFDLDLNFEQNQLTQELEENGNIQLEDNDEQEIKNDNEKNKQMQDSNVNNKGNEINNNNQNIQQNSQNNLVPYKYIGNYSFSLQDVIGSGFSSNVYLGKNVNTSETVAIKVIETKKIQNEVHKYLLDTELQVLQKIESPYIVNVKNIYQTSNNTYIIMEFCNNGDLDKQIRMKTKIPENIAAKYLRQIVIGFQVKIENYKLKVIIEFQLIQELVKKRVVHRDLKPANIMLKDETAKIADFGFSEFIDSPPFKIFYNVGSPNYMAPQALRNNRYSFKSDVWSIGALYYELLTGNTPYNAPTEEKLLFYAENIPVKFPKNVLISEESKQFIKRCMTVNEDQRIAPEEMLDHPLLKKVEREIQDSLQNRQKNKKSISFHGQDLQSNKNKLSSLINSGNNKSQQNLNLQHMQQSAHAVPQGQQQQLEYNYSQKNNIQNDKIQLESSWITEAIELQKMLDSGILEYVKEKQNSNGRQRENSIPSKNLQEEKNEQSMNSERINIQLNSSNQKQDQKIIINEQNSRQIYSGKKQQQENQPNILSIQNANLPQSRASNSFNSNFYKENQQQQHQQYQLAKQSHENVPLLSVNTRDKLIFLLLKNIMIKMNKMIELTYPLKPQQRQQNQENQNASNSEINNNMNNTSFLSNKNMNFSNNKNQDSNNINNICYNQEKFAVNHYKLDNFENYLASENG
ncbi:Protein kinase-like domain [Pseudocohnilembus persalinus]|uniref:Protein kinase-like domain n=1 Tax=Pseudocohnilembus persalinus TaxID=266149 RepID=A0A0V0R8H5_PSEPJ|nr:Protein kinase-like domain [Pseudocohnilembus persalinus]|eukprot:KRX10797.1 Protein kinase-like domain [Pseudocohnilembus persalinus]